MEIENHILRGFVVSLIARIWDRCNWQCFLARNGVHHNASSGEDDRGHAGSESFTEHARILSSASFTFCSPFRQVSSPVRP